MLRNRSDIHNKITLASTVSSARCARLAGAGYYLVPGGALIPCFSIKMVHLADQNQDGYPAVAPEPIRPDRTRENTDDDMPDRTFNPHSRTT